MIAITGWIWYNEGEVYLTFDDPETNVYNNVTIVAQGNEYQEGEDKRVYLKNNSRIEDSFWNYFTDDELNALIDNAEDISFEMGMLENDIRTLMKDRKMFTQELESENSEDEIKSNEQIVLKQKTEVFDSSLSSLI